MYAMDQDDMITSTPRSNARRAERAARTIDSPERRRIPGPRLPPPPQPFQLPAPAPLAGPTQFDDPFLNNFAAPPPRFQHLPAHLAQAVAQLPPLQPTRGRGQRGRPRVGAPSEDIPERQNRRGRRRQPSPGNLNHIPIQMQNPVPPVSICFFEKH